MLREPNAFRHSADVRFFSRYVVRWRKSSDCVTLLSLSFFDCRLCSSSTWSSYSRRVHRCANCAIIRLLKNDQVDAYSITTWPTRYHLYLHRPHTMARRNIFSLTVTVTVTKGADLEAFKKPTKRWSSSRHGVIRRRMPYRLMSNPLRAGGSQSKRKKEKRPKKKSSYTNTTSMFPGPSVTSLA